MCVNTAAMGHTTVKEYGDGPLPIGTPFEFESDLFRGKCLIRFRDVEVIDDKSGNYEKYFEGRSRKWQFVMQGKFKEELPTSSLMQGAEFAKPWTDLPPKPILFACQKVLGALSPYGSDNDFTSETPKAMSCMASNTRDMRKDKPGEEPDITSLYIEEDCSKFGSHFSKNKVTQAKRKKYLSNPKNGFVFDTDHVYTFSYHDHLFSMRKDEIDMYGIVKKKVSTIFDGQPMNATTKTTDGRYVASFQFWHKDMLMTTQ